MTGTVSWAQARRPIAGETACGDLGVVVPFDGGTVIGVFDGLGHGPEAAAAAECAAAALRESPSLRPVDLARHCHEALRGTRGVAAMVASISSSGALSWVGIGNVEGWWFPVGLNRRREALLSAAGVLGYQIPTLRSREATLGFGDTLVFATDGLYSSFVEAVSPTDDLASLADRLLYQYARPQDDALVLVARFGGGA